MGGQLYFIYLSQKDRYIQPHDDHETYNARRSVIDAVSSLDIPVVDIHEEVFNNQTYPFSLYYAGVNFSDTHYNKTGYSAVAEAIISRVRKLTMEDDTAMLEHAIAK